MNDNPQAFGLKPLPPDHRDFALGALVRLPALEELPPEFVYEGLPIKYQGQTDWCTAFATCLASEAQEEEPLEPAWSFAAGKELSNDVNEWGQDIRMAHKAHQEPFGALAVKDNPFAPDEKDATFLRHFENWPENLRNKALVHAKKSYVAVTGPYDAFDNIRASMWLYRTECRLVTFGVTFGWNIADVYLEEVVRGGFGHAMAVVGWAVRGGDTWLVVQNSYGTEAGEKGRHYVSRKVINHFASLYGLFMFVDHTPEEIKYMLDNKVKISDNWLMVLVKAVLTLFKII